MRFLQRAGFFFSFFLFVAGWVIWGQRASAQTEDARYFPETGHWVSGEFLVKYQEIANPADIYGAPITESFFDAESNREIQYFEKARFEFDPHLPGGLQVQLSALGEALYEPGTQISGATNATACRAFAQSQFAVCYAFLDFFEANGGVAQFGYPISGFEIHDGWIVQYFQKARFEWHPENASGQHVTLSNLGYQYFYARREDPTLLNPVLQNEVPNLPVLNIRAEAFAHKAVLPLGGSQRFYFIVQDEYRNPIEGAEVNFVLVFPDGSSQNYQAPNTNEVGVSTYGLDIHSNQPGMVKVLVQVIYGTLTTQTRTSFFLWW